MKKITPFCSIALLLTAIVLAGMSLGRGGQWSLIRTVSAQSQYEEVLRRQQAAARQLRRRATAATRFDRLSTRVVERGVVPVIVTLRVAFSAQSEIREGLESRVQRARIASVREELVDNLYGYDPDSIKRYDRLPVLAVRVNASGLEALRQSDDVIDIQEDKLNRPSLAESVPFIGAPAAWASGYSGSGQLVAVLDTGVVKVPPMLRGRVGAVACYSTNSSGSSSTSLCPGRSPSSTAVNSALPCPSGCEHGTHVAGIVAGNSVSYGGQSFSGVARDARLIAIQVFSEVNSVDECGEEESPCYLSFDSDILKGLQHVLELRATYPIAAANMSLGGGRYFANCDESDAAMKQMIDLLRAANIATIVASGNDGYKDSMSSPACISTAISVGATRDTANRTASFSNSASFLNLLAPGAGITSAVPGGGYDRWSGTSMATPHVSAAWAILRQKAPTASVPSILNALVTSGVGVADTNGITKPRIQVDAALTQLQTLPPVIIPSLTLTPVSATQIDLSWAFPAGNHIGYRLYRQVGTATTATLVTTLGAHLVSYQDKGLLMGTNYRYRIAAYDAGGRETAAVEATAQTSRLGVNPPASFTATAQTNTQINLSWIDNNSSETGYRLLRRVGAETTWKTLTTLGPNVTSYEDTSLDAGQVYGYSIAAVDGGGEALSPTILTVNLPSMPFSSLTSGQPASIRVGKAQNRYYKIYVPVKTSTLTIQTVGSGDIDLYIQTGRQPSIKVNSCASDGENSTEKCVISNPTSGDWHILVYGYAPTSYVTLTATYLSGSAAAGHLSRAAVITGAR
ncbi:MAG: S8 family serine peptidase [Acidobacteriota bacterium]